jgi:hypothetical protein
LRACADGHPFGWRTETPPESKSNTKFFAILSRTQNLLWRRWNFTDTAKRPRSQWKIKKSKGRENSNDQTRRGGVKPEEPGEGLALNSRYFIAKGAGEKSDASTLQVCASGVRTEK